jgi:hypothetical protein
VKAGGKQRISGFLLGLFFDLEKEGDMFIRNIRLSPNYPDNRTLQMMKFLNVYLSPLSVCFFSLGFKNFPSALFSKPPSNLSLRVRDGMSQPYKTTVKIMKSTIYW